MAITDLSFDLKDAEEIGKAVLKLKEITGKTASECADMIFSQNNDAKILLFGNSHRSNNGVATTIH